MFPEFCKWKPDLQRTGTSIFLLQMETETANFCLFAANGNKKKEICFPWSASDK
jgi:hypothetical protein